MPAELTRDWAKIRHDYEHTGKPVEDICRENAISSGTLRDRVRRWNWRRRWAPIPPEGPPAAPSLPSEDIWASDHYDDHDDREGRHGAGDAPLPAMPQIAPSLPSPASWGGVEGGGDNASAPAESDPAMVMPRLQNAVARVMPAIEATVARLAAQPAHPREMERAARMLAALTRTLRELNTLLKQRPVSSRCTRCDDIPEDIDEFRRKLAARINAFVRARTGGAGADTDPQGTS